jgi:hypothetical protein
MVESPHLVHIVGNAACLALPVFLTRLTFCLTRLTFFLTILDYFILFWGFRMNAAIATVYEHFDGAKKSLDMRRKPDILFSETQKHHQRKQQTHTQGRMKYDEKEA